MPRKLAIRSLRRSSLSLKSASLSQRCATLAGPSPLLDLSRITAPALVRAGREVGMVPCAHALSIAEEMWGTRTLLLAGVGHVNTMQALALVAPVTCRFLGVAYGMSSSK